MCHWGSLLPQLSLVEAYDTLAGTGGAWRRKGSRGHGAEAWLPGMSVLSLLSYQSPCPAQISSLPAGGPLCILVVDLRATLQPSLVWGEGLALSLTLGQLTKPPPSLITPLSAAQPLCTMYCKDTAFLARSPWSKQNIIGSSCSEDRSRQHFMTLQSYQTYLEFAWINLSPYIL